MIDHPTPRILVIGRTTLDVLTISDRQPQPGQQLLGEDYRIQPGGSGLNVAVALAALNNRVSLCSRVGADFAGDYIRRTLAEREVDVSSLVSDSSVSTSLSIISIMSDGEIGIHHHIGANKILSRSDVPISSLDSYDAVHVGGAMLLPSLDGRPLAEILEQARSCGLVTSLNATRNTERKQSLFPVLPFLDLIFMNKREAHEISGCDDLEASCRWFIGQGVKTVVVTLGSQGALVSTGKSTDTVPGIGVTAVDTTGCGDSFCAGYLSAALRSIAPQLAARWANGIAAHCARTIGAVVTPFHQQEIKEMIQSQQQYGTSAALVLAGGHSKRMLNVSQKLLMYLCGKPLITWTIECVRLAGVHRIIAILGHEGERIKHSLRFEPVEPFETGEQDLGTGYVVSAALQQLNDLPDTLFVVNGDTPLLRPETLHRLRERLVDSGAAAVVCTSETPDFQKYGHGVVVRDREGRFERVEHFSIASETRNGGEINTGTYCFRREALEQSCRKLQPAPDGKIHFSDILLILNQRYRVESLRIDDFKQFISANTHEHYAELDKELTEQLKKGRQ